MATIKITISTEKPASVITQKTMSINTEKAESVNTQKTMSKNTEEAVSVNIPKTSSESTKKSNNNQDDVVEKISSLLNIEREKIR